MSHPYILAFRWQYNHSSSSSTMLQLQSNQRQTEQDAYRWTICEAFKILLRNIDFIFKNLRIIFVCGEYGGLQPELQSKDPINEPFEGMQPLEYQLEWIPPILAEELIESVPLTGR